MITHKLSIKTESRYSLSVSEEIVKGNKENGKEINKQNCSFFLLVEKIFLLIK